MTDHGYVWSQSLGETTQDRASRVATAHHAAADIAGACAQRRVCVQAGGHVGVWPIALRQHFEWVYTFEPDAENWAALVQNVRDPQIVAARGAVGARPGGVRLDRTKPKSGLWRTIPGGPIPTYTVDHLALPELDALVLDVERGEWDALRGASATLERCHPVIWFEGRVNLEPIAAWVRTLGYASPVPARGRDWVCRPERQMATL